MDYVSNLLSFIPNKELERFALATQVDKYAKKLHGELLFKLLFYCLITEKDTSLRSMQSALESALFRAISNSAPIQSIAHSSISERLNTVRFQYFEKIFQHCANEYKSRLGTVERNIIRFDSTIVSLSSRLLQVGYNLKGGDAEQFQLLKFTVGYSDVPDCICFYTGQTYNSENVALTETIISNKPTGKQISVFDRGITSRGNYDLLTDNNILFVSRIDPNAKHIICKANTVKATIDTGTLIIVSDSWVYLYTMKGSRSKHSVRIIQAIKKADGEPISFITNVSKMKPVEIAQIYKSRWEIEIFFKFIKQHLNFSHLLNRTENGIKVIMYVTMTAAILLAQYKNDKGIRGYKIAKQKFAQDLEKNIIYNIILICNGNSDKAKQILYPNTS